jgi:hypothetical protein
MMRRIFAMSFQSSSCSKGSAANFAIRLSAIVVNDDEISASHVCELDLCLSHLKKGQTLRVLV